MPLWMLSCYLRSRHAEPLCSSWLALRHALAVEIHQAKVHLRVHLALVGSHLKILRSSRMVHRHTLPLEVAVTQMRLGTRGPLIRSQLPEMSCLLHIATHTLLQTDQTDR